jgi:hypothetical protein
MPVAMSASFTMSPGTKSAAGQFFHTPSRRTELATSLGLLCFAAIAVAADEMPAALSPQASLQAMRARP